MKLDGVTTIAASKTIITNLGRLDISKRKITHIIGIPQPELKYNNDKRC